MGDSKRGCEGVQRGLRGGVAVCMMICALHAPHVRVFGVVGRGRRDCVVFLMYKQVSRIRSICSVIGGTGSGAGGAGGGSVGA